MKLSKMLFVVAAVAVSAAARASSTVEITGALPQGVCFKSLSKQAGLVNPQTAVAKLFYSYESAGAVKKGKIQVVVKRGMTPAQTSNEDTDNQLLATLQYWSNRGSENIAALDTGIRSFFAGTNQALETLEPMIAKARAAACPIGFVDLTAKPESYAP